MKRPVNRRAPKVRHPFGERRDENSIVIFARENFRVLPAFPPSPLLLEDRGLRKASAALARNLNIVEKFMVTPSRTDNELS